MKNEKYPIDFNVIVAEKEKEVYIQFTGFESVEDAEAYADHLSDYLPLMLFESTVLH